MARPGLFDYWYCVHDVESLTVWRVERDVTDPVAAREKDNAREEVSNQVAIPIG
jgi:hypothetical protein